ncbi:MAG: rod shape-determining protein MreC [Chloroflexi bacterium]|nr:rod shape-determining protein MreC [Chloroflexota bacterium]
MPILIVIAGIMLLINLGAQTTQAVESPFSFILAPLQQVFSGLGRAASDLFRSAGELQDLRLRVRVLETEVDNLTTENVRLREFQAEVKQYRELLQFKNDNPAFTVVGADVIGVGNPSCRSGASDAAASGICANVIAGDSSPYSRYITINVGRIHGISTGMPVVAGGFALVGRVGQVNETSSQVQLLIDSTSYVNSLLVESRATGVVAGQSDGSLHIINVPQTDELKPGDLIVTSGLGGKLPRLLTIGQVDRVISTDAQLFKAALVRPAVDFNRIEVVLVITATSSN